MEGIYDLDDDHYGVKLEGNEVPQMIRKSNMKVDSIEGNRERKKKMDSEEL